MNPNSFQGFDPEIEDHKNLSPQEIVKALRSGGASVPDEDLLYSLSGLTDSDLRQIMPVWRALETEYRRIVMQMLADINDTQYQYNYDIFAMANLDDPDAGVRQSAIEILSESEDHRLIERLIRISTEDEVPSVRAEAIRALGNFVLLGELGDLPDAAMQMALNHAFAILNNQNEADIVRRRALEAVANSSHRDVTRHIEEAYHSGDDDMRTSAVTAMGRSCDSRWTAIVMTELESEDVAMRTEAARASGDLQLEAAVPTLGQFLVEGSREEQYIAIWALGEIGTREAVRLLNAVIEMAEERDDDELAELAEDALDSASLARDDMLLFDMDIDFDDDEV